MTRRILKLLARRKLAALAAAALPCCAVGAQTMATDSDSSTLAGYQLGQGLRLGDSGVTVGGYITAEYQRTLDQPGRWRSSHASVFFWWEGAADNPATRGLKLLGELDHENSIVQRADRAAPTTPALHGRRPRNSPNPLAGDSTEQRLSLQRLHVDWAASEHLLLRGGKFLTPVGRWNLAHAGPLVWTTSRPLITQQALPQNVTGLLATVRWPIEEQLLSATAYASNGREWRADPQQDPFAQVSGLRVLSQFGLPLRGRLQAGLSWAHYQQSGSRGEPRRLLGADAVWSWHGWEISLEALDTRARTAARASAPMPPPTTPGGARNPAPAATAPGAGPGGNPRVPPVALPTRGSYVQAVAPLAPQWSGVVRAEWLRDTDASAGMRQTTLGITWRPQPTLAVKVEYQWPTGRTDLAPRGWLGSVSVLF